MTRTLTAIAAATALLAAPGIGMAQNQSTGSKNLTEQQRSQSQQGSMQSGGSGASGQGMSSQDYERVVASQEDVRERLTEAGFSEVDVLNAAYLVQAVAPNGDPVMMMIDASGQMRQMNGSQGSRQGSGSQMNRSSDSDSGQRNQQGTGNRTP